MHNLTRYLETRLKLKVKPAKSKVAPMSDCRFLGFTLRGTKIRWSDKPLANFGLGLAAEVADDSSASFRHADLGVNKLRPSRCST